jgi:hypothetical protein
MCAVSSSHTEAKVLEQIYNDLVIIIIIIIIMGALQPGRAQAAVNTVP